ncbi:MAG: 4-hydroxythreonine-4-phosphate dehydrogenase PdxA [Oligoflexia bacterium]|nr:4-hydroxythreonine-4-phosphate dehydrogenase PdxA [Oligoflexia bacterium]
MDVSEHPPSKLLVLTPGMGIGPEVTLRALAQRPALWPRVVLAGRAEALRAVGSTLRLVEVNGLQPVQQGLAVFDPTDQHEPAEVAAIRAGAMACLDHRAAALVTGPIHKGRLAARGFAFHGHTDFLGHLCARDAVMAFAGGRFGVALVTVHIPLAQVPAAATAAAVCHVTRTAATAWRDELGFERPRIAVCGLNPHAGEGGLLGTEERDTIGPACDLLRAEGWDLTGPVSAETAVMEAMAGRRDLVIAMYHDQGLAPLKAVDFGRTVNWTLGLPITRTSVDHGTADALVGTGKADCSSMGAALDLAVRVVDRTPHG